MNTKRIKKDFDDKSHEIVKDLSAGVNFNRDNIYDHKIYDRSNSKYRKKVK